MTVYSLSHNPPRWWDEACSSGRHLFGSTAWQNMLNDSFSARTVYAWDETRASGAAFTLFRAGPFNVAYQGFPLGSVLGEALDYQALIDTWRGDPGLRVPVCLRIPVSAFAPTEPPRCSFVETPETAIASLQDWEIRDASNNIRRDLKKARNSGLEFLESAGPDLADSVYALYRDTIRRHKGSLRYSRAYFNNLLRLSQAEPKLRVSVALDAGDVVAFNVAAIDGSGSYYLHGGINPEANAKRPGAPLMSAAIHWARDAGCESFNFMSSPADQPSLVQYKEKWGGETRAQRTYTLRLSAVYSIFRFAERAYSLIS